MIYSLRAYQQDLCDRLFQLWQSGQRRLMLQLGTGGGKTVIFGSIAARAVEQGQRVLVLAHREELVTQATSKLGAIADCPVGIIKAEYKPFPLAPIQIASIQTLTRRPGAAGAVDLVVTDEAHHASAATYRAIYEQYPDARHLGVTATPIRTDGTGFDDLFDELICGPTVRQLIDDGHLCDFKLYADANPMETKGVRTRAGDYSTSQLAQANDAVALSGNLIDSYRNYGHGKRAVVFAINVQHSKAIAERYIQAGIPAAHIDGKTSSSDRRDVLECFSRGEIWVLCNCGIVTEGFDVPAIEVMQVARPTKSLSLWLQMLGRGLRIYPGKQHAIVIDHTDNWAMHGLPDRQFTWTLEGVESDEVRRHVIRKADGEVVEKELPAERASVLVEVDPADAKYQADLATLERLFSEQRSRGYKLGWIAYKFLDTRPSFAGLVACAKALGYHPRWARHKFCELYPEAA